MKRYLQGLRPRRAYCPGLDADRWVVVEQQDAARRELGESGTTG